MFNETFENQENQDTFDFDEFLHLNQFSNLTILQRFLKDVWRELSTEEGINLDTFREFICLPSYISDKIFNLFDKNKKKFLGLNDFLRGMLTLYNGKYNELTKFIFDFYDFDKDGRIIYEDVKQIELLILPSQFHNDEVFECINNTLDLFFEKSKFMNYERFIEVLRNTNSDIFMNLMIYFYVNKPFSNDIINYYLSDKRLSDEITVPKTSKLVLKKTLTMSDNENIRTRFSVCEKNRDSVLKSKNLKNSPKKIIKTPQNNIYFKKISENYSRMVTYTDNELGIENQSAIPEEIDSEYEYENLEDPGDENISNFIIKIPEFPRLKNLFDSKLKSSVISVSTNFDKTSALLTKKSLSDDIVNSAKKNMNKTNDNDFKIVIKTVSPPKQKNNNLSISNNSINNNKKVIKKFTRSFTFNYQKSNLSNIQEENSNSISNDLFINEDSLQLKVLNKKTYETFINKFNEKKSKIIKYYIVLNNKMMLYFKNDCKSQFRGLHYLKDNSTLVTYDKNKTILVNGVKYYYLNLIIKNSTKWFVSKNEFEMRKWSEVFKKTINPNKSRNLKDFYTFKETICDGKYGLVKRAINRKTKEEVSIKIINKKNLISEKKTAFIFKEIEILRHCNHKSILKYIDHFEEIIPEENKNFVYIIMEYLSGGDLAAYIHKNGALHEKKVISIAWNIAKGIEYLHKLGIIHRDIKPENIVFDNFFKPRIVDFGLSEIIGYNEFLNESYGTFLYASPEIHNNWKYNRCTDIWSFGVLIYYILTADLPFQRNKETAHNCISNLEEEIVFDNINYYNSSVLLKDLITNCLKKDVNKRFNINQVLKHEIFEKFQKNEN